ncbi:hypothetical protein HOY82DRAFT_612223 [Tuber indicum]|nr:hypothetical protein HOY82DRAFT_612223 [Tuber indicum]
MPPLSAAIDPTSHRTLRYFPHFTPYRSFKNFIFLFYLTTKIIYPNHDLTHYPNKLVDIYTSNRTLDLSSIPFGTIGTSILFPEIPLPGFPKATCEGQTCRFELAAADRDLTEQSRQELWRSGMAAIAELSRRVGEWYKESALGGVISGHGNLLLPLNETWLPSSYSPPDEVWLLTTYSSSAAMDKNQGSTCELNQAAHRRYRAQNPIPQDGQWAHWLSGHLNDGLHLIPCPYMDYAFIGIVLRDLLGFLASAGYTATFEIVSLLLAVCRCYVPAYGELSRDWIPLLPLLERLWSFLLTTCGFILFSAANVLISTHSLFTILFGIPPLLSEVPLSWFGGYYRRHPSSSQLPVLLCGILFWFGILASWRTPTPISGLLFPALLTLVKHTYFLQQATRRVRYYRGAYARASLMLGPYVSYLARQVLVDITVLLMYLRAGDWITGVFWYSVVPNWVKYSPTIGALACYLGIRYALSGGYPSGRWVFRGLGRSEVVSVTATALPGELSGGRYSRDLVRESEDIII